MWLNGVESLLTSGKGTIFVALVIGLSFPESHDSSIAAVLDGRLVFATEEERYTRHRYSLGEKPGNSLIEAFRFLKKFGVEPEDVDAFALSWDTRLNPLSANLNRYPFRLFETRQVYQASYQALARTAWDSFRDKLSESAFALYFLKSVYKQIGKSFPSSAKIVPVIHHLAHAASAYYFSGFHSAAVLTIDGKGERDGTVVWKARNGEFERVASVNFWDGSLGFLYEFTAVRLGFDRYNGPGKVMGLAPYGQADPDLDARFNQSIKLMEAGEVPYLFTRRFGPKQIDSMYEGLTDYVSGGVRPSWNPRTEVSRIAADIARALQRFTDRAVLHTARWTKERTGETNLCLAGGVALNAKSNMEVYYSKLYNEMFVFPAANDAGTAIGAAAYVYEHVLGGKMETRKLETAYLGPGYDDDLVKSTLRTSKWKGEFLGDDVGPVADLVSRGHVVAWYQGRSELGPRALGNRSVVADPTKKENWSIVNQIKGRESWRPLAPSVLDSDAGEYFVDPCDHRFMILMFRMKTEGSQRAPAISHVDRTARPQVVSRGMNSTWFDLIKAFKEERGEGIIINTSFNLAGEPLVQTPADALKSFAVGGFDALFLQGWLLRKE